jgi:hypothetical protein
MTTQPGLGYFFYNKYHENIDGTDQIVIKTAKGYKPVPVPRYYNKKLKEMNEERFEEIKSKRIEKMIKQDLAHPEEKSHARRAVKAEVREHKTKVLQRKL